MKISKTQKSRISVAVENAVSGILHGNHTFATDSLTQLIELGISIGVELAMKHKHHSLEPVYSGAQLIRYDEQETSKAEAIDHE